MANIVHESGKRKEAVARTTVKDGKGNVRINSVPLSVYEPEMARLKIKQALVIASEHIDLDKVDIIVNSHGGGVFGQADAIASSIARTLVSWSKSDELKNAYISYDRTLIAGDHRQTEVHKPSQSSKGPRHRTQKSYR